MLKSPIMEEMRAEGRVQGRLEEARAIIQRQGRVKFGRPPSKKQQAELDAADLARLEELSERVLTAATWGELLGGV